jgi:hypothetical protein
VRLDKSLNIGAAKSNVAAKLHEADFPIGYQLLEASLRDIQLGGCLGRQ